MLNVPIIPPRVAFIDPRTGNVSREWYMFFLSLFESVGGSELSLDDLQKAPLVLPDAETQKEIDALSSGPSLEGVVELWAAVNQEVQALQATPYLQYLDDLATLRQEVQALQSAPAQDDSFVFAAIEGLTSPPVTKTADFAVADGEKWLINNKSGSGCVVTLPSAAAKLGRELHFQNYQAQTVTSASSNVVPMAGGAAGTAILAAAVGDHATLVSDGTNWVMTQYN